MLAKEWVVNDSIQASSYVFSPGCQAFTGVNEKRCDLQSPQEVIQSDRTVESDGRYTLVFRAVHRCSRLERSKHDKEIGRTTLSGSRRDTVSMSAGSRICLLKDLSPAA